MGKAYAPKLRKHTQSRTCRQNSCSPCHQLFTVPHCWEMQRCICDTLSRLCGTVGVNPFRDSEAETPGPTPPPTRPAWRDRAPPTAPITASTNSWLYVPLLWAAAGLQTQAAAQAWQTQCGEWWTLARDTLADAPPVDLEAFRTALNLTPSAGAVEQLARLTAAGPFPAGAHAYLRWLLQTLADADGYIPAASQETCLQLYGGLPFAAALDRQANLFRAPPTPDPAPVPAFTTAIPSPSIPPLRSPHPHRPAKAPAAADAAVAIALLPPHPSP